MQLRIEVAVIEESDEETLIGTTLDTIMIQCILSKLTFSHYAKNQARYCMHYLAFRFSWNWKDKNNDEYFLMSHLD